MPFLKRMLLPFTVFITGACVLVIEIVATRILAPYFGNTIFSVSSVISVVLAALSCGYYVGGRLADRKPSQKLFFGIITASGLMVLCMQFFQSSILPTLSYMLPLTYGPLVVSMILFFVPSFILGMLSPYAIILQQRQIKDQGLGTTTGEMFFFSTLGSIVGGLLAGFVLIPSFGVEAIMIGVGVVLVLLGLVPLLVLGMGRKEAGIVLLLAALLSTQTGSPQVSGTLYSSDGLYEKIVVRDGTFNKQRARFLSQDTNTSAGMYLHSDEMVFDYTKYYALYELFVPEPQRVLVLGGGAYTIPKVFLKDLPTTKVDVAEIEPELYELSQRYFGLKENPRLTNYVQDARRMLHDTPHRYDVIFNDVYHSMFSIPSHLTTKEFLQLTRDKLQPDGVFIANIISSLDQRAPSFLWSEIKTMQQVFPNVQLFAVNSPSEPGIQNIIAIGSMNATPLDMNDPRLQASKHEVLLNLAQNHLDIKNFDLRPHTILTDDYAPVDIMMADLLSKRYE